MRMEIEGLVSTSVVHVGACGANVVIIVGLFQSIKMQCDGRKIWWGELGKVLLGEGKEQRTSDRT